MTPRIDPTHCKFRLRIERSSIHRWGLFALEAIPRDRKVIEYTGDRLTWAQADRRFRRLGAGSRNTYFARVTRRLAIDGYFGGSGAQFANHSCDLSLVPQRLRGRLWFVSRRKIRAGEELTVDYDYAKDTSKTPCACGSPKCRGTRNRV